MAGDLIDTIRSPIGDIHTAGNPGRGMIDESQEVCCPVVCGRIAAAGCTGFVGHELRTDLHPLEALRTRHQICACPDPTAHGPAAT